MPGHNLDGHITAAPGSPIRVTDGDGFALGMVSSVSGRACNATNRGEMVVVRGASGVDDGTYRCTYDGTSAYAWKQLPAFPADPNADRVLVWDDSAGEFVYATVGTGLSISATPSIDLDSDLQTIAGLTATTDNMLVAVSSAWASRTPAQVRTTLAQGLTQIGTATSVSGSSDAAVSGCFSADYEGYLVYAHLVMDTANASLLMRLRSGGSNDSNASYYSSLMVNTSASATVGGAATAAGTSFTVVTNGGAGVTHTDVGVTVWVQAPFAADETRIEWHGATRSSTPLSRVDVGGGMFNATTSFDGFSFIPSGGTVTGTIRVYGRRGA